MYTNYKDRLIRVMILFLGMVIIMKFGSLINVTSFNQDRFLNYSVFSIFLPMSMKIFAEIIILGLNLTTSSRKMIFSKTSRLYGNEVFLL